MNHLHKILIAALLLAFSTTGKAQLTVDNNAPYDDPTYLVQNVMLNTGVFISNVTFNGSPLPPVGANKDMIGYFNGSSSNIGITEGVLFNTGSIFDAIGPNNSGSDGIDNGTAGDVDLTALTAFTLPTPSPTYNAAVLEFDFETVTDAIGFRYVFASEEYNEFVCTDYNDVFGFFISGPGISGPFSNGGENIALIPSNGAYVAINAVNNGTVGSAGGVASNCSGGGLGNSIYFVDNENPTPGQTIQYDGFTTVLEAYTELTPCETYHIKIAVGDAGDGIYDSGLFLEAASFGAIGIQVDVGEVGTSSASIIEGCDSIKVIFSRAGGTTDPMTIHFIISGSATNGVDYPYFADSIVIPADSSTTSFYLSAFLDGLPEGLEIINITIPADLTNTTCLDDIPSTATISIVNTDPLQLTASNDTMLCPGDVAQLASTVTGGLPGYSYVWTPSAGLSCTTCPNPVATPAVATTYTLSVTDICSTDTVTEDVVINLGGMTLTPTNGTLVSVEGCKQASFTFTRSGSTADPLTIYFTVGGNATNGTDYAFIADSVIIPAGQTSVEIVVLPTLDGIPETNESVIITTIPDTSVCAGPPVTTTLFIMNVDPITVVASNDTIICGGVATAINATAAGGVFPLLYTWVDGIDTLQVGTSGFLSIAPNMNTTYTVTVSDTCGNAVAVELVNVGVTAPPPTIASVQDTAYEGGCRDAMFTISRTDTTTSELVVYYTITGSAANNTDYTTIFDSVIILAGTDSVDIIVSAVFDGILEGYETIVLTLPRDPSDNLCYVIPFKDSIFIRNIEPMTVDVPPQTICPGENATLTATSTGGVGPVSYLWNSTITGNTISANPTTTSLYTIEVTDTCGNGAIRTDVEVIVRDVLGFVADPGVTAYEGCKDTEFIFSLPTTLPNDFTLNYVLSGSATVGSDFDPLPSSITIPAGDLTATLAITTLLDGDSEGIESLVVTIIPQSYNDTDFCAHEFIASVDIADVVPLEIVAAGDTSMCNFAVPISSLATGGFGPLSYVWNNGAGVGSGVFVNPAQTTTYTVTVVDSCQSGTALDSLVIEVDCEYLFFAPNSFTPNEDGLNDVFNARWKGMKTYKMQIFNRWGDLVFMTDDRLEGWDGTANGSEKLSEQEVYIYIFETTDFLDLPHYYIGRVALIQ